MRNSRMLAGVTLVVFISLLGCNPTAAQPTPTPTIPLEAGWQRIEKPSDGFAIALPPMWKEIGLQTIETTFKTLSEQNPEFAPTFKQMAGSLVDPHVKFFTMDLSLESTAAGYVTNMTIFKETLPTAMTLDVMVQPLVVQLENQPDVVKPITHRRVSITAGQAEEFHFPRAGAKASGQAFKAAQTQYLFTKEKDVYVIVTTTTADQADKYAPIFEKMAQSFAPIK